MGWFTEENREAINPQALPTPAAIVDVRDYVDVMREALSKHRTQVPPDSFLMQWPAQVWQTQPGLVSHLVLLRAWARAFWRLPRAAWVLPSREASSPAPFAWPAA